MSFEDDDPGRVAMREAEFCAEIERLSSALAAEREVHADARALVELSTRTIEDIGRQRDAAIARAESAEVEAERLRWLLDSVARTHGCGDHIKNRIRMEVRQSPTDEWSPYRLRQERDDARSRLTVCERERDEARAQATTLSEAATAVLDEIGTYDAARSDLGIQAANAIERLRDIVRAGS